MIHNVSDIDSMIKAPITAPIRGSSLPKVPNKPKAEPAPVLPTVFMNRPNVAIAVIIGPNI